MKLIIGLGNPGPEYEKTRHNVGFMILDQIAQQKGVEFFLQDNFYAKIAEISDGKDKIKLIKPQTFMNESGKAAAKLKTFFKIETDDIWIIHDDVDLPLGKVKIQFDGSSAGHRGIQSIIDNVGDQFWRVRIGIGRSEKIPTDSYVLQKFEDLKKIEKIINFTADLVVKNMDENITSGTFTIE